MLAVSKKSYDSSKSYGQKEAFDVLGNCSLAKAHLVDENNQPAEQKSNEECGLIWLSASGSVWLRASWPHSARVEDIL